MDEDIRRELDQLHQTDRDLRQAISELDNHGSRGVLTLQGQVTDLIKDLAEVRVSMATHERQHEDERKERRTNRKWIVGTVAASLGGFATVIGFLLDIAKHVH